MNRKAQNHLVTGIVCLLPALVYPLLNVFDNNLANFIPAASFLIAAGISFYLYFKEKDKTN